ncbi:hypothetical protein [Brevibacterium luteolum]|uniref:hypothetical protein n=1 Tax=Brevibacterium luteolum TaxID=199591 RepID=UPI00223B13FB|nr:hypothetical protein [Brevibacterium luteolum]MCT1655824.1 hypothetical protein [Brevibacterium luteolum]
MARQPASRRRRALLFSGVAGAVVVALIAAIVWFTGLRESSPAGTVRDYLSKLAAGDAAGALAMAEHDIPAGESTLLTDEVLAGADRIEQVEITGTETKGDTAVVTADYRLGLGMRTTEFTLHRAGPKGLFFSDWRLEAPELERIIIDTPHLSEAAVNGVTVPAFRQQITLPAFPGIYTIGVPEDDEFVTAKEVRVYSAFPTASEPQDSYSLIAEPTERFTEAVNAEVRAIIDDCARKDEANPAGCPLTWPDAERYDLSDLRWSVKEYPTVGLRAASELRGESAEDGWRLSGERSGTAQISGLRSRFGDAPERFEQELYIRPEGTAMLDENGDGTLRIDTDDS